MSSSSDIFEDFVGAFEMADASKNLFTGGRMGDDDVGSVGPSTQGPSTGPTAFVEHASVDSSWGPSGLGRTGKLLPFDTAAAWQDRPVPFRATYNRVMSDDDARKAMASIIRHCGAVGQVESVQLSLVNAILLSHAKNSGSIVQPSRAKFQVAGSRPLNFYEDVVLLLGEDVRRFFRAYADQAREVVRERLQGFRDGRSEYEEDYRDIMMVARQRGLERYPDLICDSADACTNLSRVEMDAIGMSKVSVLSRSNNVADVVRNYRVASSNPSVPEAHEYAGPAGRPGPDY